MFNNLQREKINRNLSLALITSLVLFFLLYFFIQFNLFLGVLALLIFLVFIFSLFYPLKGVMAFIVIRPLLDIFTYDDIFSLNGLRINLASLAGLLIILLTIYLLFKIGIKKIKERGLNVKIFWVWLMFLAINILSFLVSIDYANSLREVVRFLSIFSFFILGSILINSASSLTKILKSILISALIPALTGIYHLIFRGSIFVDYEGRLAATFAHPNMLAFYLFFVIAIALFIFLYGFKKNILSYFYAFLGLLFFVPLMITYTRGAWLALILFLIVIGIFKFRKILFISILFFSLTYISIPSLQSRVNNAFRINDYNSSISWRFDLYRDLWQYSQDRPWLGYGIDNASLVIAQNRDPHLGSAEPHNDYLKILLETGYIGLIIYLMFLIILVLELFKKYKLDQPIRVKYFNFFLIAIVIALSVASFGDNILNDTALQWSLWVVLGAFLSLNSYPVRPLEKKY